MSQAEITLVCVPQGEAGLRGPAGEEGPGGIRGVPVGPARIRGPRLVVLTRDGRYDVQVVCADVDCVPCCRENEETMEDLGLKEQRATR